jgi:hypothetical protein
VGVVEWGLLPHPLLDLSAYIEPRRDEYYQRLLAVSREGDWVGWIGFFLTAVKHHAADAVSRGQRLQLLREEFRSRVATTRSSGLLGLLVDAVFDTPAITIPRPRNCSASPTGRHDSTSTSSSGQASSPRSAIGHVTSCSLPEMCWTSSKGARSEQRAATDD